MSTGLVAPRVNLGRRGLWGRTLRQRMARMAALWALLGVIVGAQSLPATDFIALLSGAIAGIIVLPWLGAFLALLGGEVLPSLAGASCGCLVALVYAEMLGDPHVAYKLNLGLMIGGIVGANYATLSALRRLRRRKSPVS